MSLSQMPTGAAAEIFAICKIDSSKMPVSLMSGGNGIIRMMVPTAIAQGTSGTANRFEMRPTKLNCPKAHIAYGEVSMVAPMVEPINSAIMGDLILASIQFAAAPP